MRGTSPATVRQQARSVYQKPGLSGKAALSAYFLKELLPPVDGSVVQIAVEQDAPAFSYTKSFHDKIQTQIASRR